MIKTVHMHKLKRNITAVKKILLLKYNGDIDKI